MLFSALSPAIAGVLFAGRADIMARMLALPVQVPTYGPGDICHTDVSAPADAAAATDADTELAAHGIHCSFCLSASSVVTLPLVAASAVAFALTAPEPLPAVRVQRPPFSVPLTHHSRAPPAPAPAR